MERFCEQYQVDPNPFAEKLVTRRPDMRRLPSQRRKVRRPDEASFDFVRKLKNVVDLICHAFRMMVKQLDHVLAVSDRFIREYKILFGNAIDFYSTPPSATL